MAREKNTILEKVIMLTMAPNSGSEQVNEDILWCTVGIKPSSFEEVTVYLTIMPLGMSCY